jgi:hypothetical protein
MDQINYGWYVLNNNQPGQYMRQANYRSNSSTLAKKVLDDPPAKTKRPLFSRV